MRYIPSKLYAPSPNAAEAGREEGFFSLSTAAVIGRLALEVFTGMGTMMVIGRLSSLGGKSSLMIGLEEMMSLHSAGYLCLTSDTEAKSTG